jgi:uncharacterized membrane-anchored protein
MSTWRVVVAASLLSTLAFAKPPRPKPAPAAPSHAAPKPDDEAAPGDEGTAAGEPEEAAEPLPPGMTAGPAQVKLGSNAGLAVPEGALFGDQAATKSMLEKSGNLTSGREVGMLLADDDVAVIFEFDPSGYVKDDDKDALDADKMLASLREGQDEANEELKKLGRPELEIARWQVKPHYEASSHNLEWGPVVKNKQNGHETVNYNVRLLGRRGVMEVTLLVSPEQLDAKLPWFRSTLKGFGYSQGEDYASFRQGDKVAEYGLAALVTGGAVAVAAKSGLLGKLWKVILAALAALGAGVKRMFSGKRAPPAEPSSAEPPAAE